MKKLVLVATLLSFVLCGVCFAGSKCVVIKTPGTNGANLRNGAGKVIGHFEIGQELECLDSVGDRTNVIGPNGERGTIWNPVIEMKAYTPPLPVEEPKKEASITQDEPATVESPAMPQEEVKPSEPSSPDEPPPADEELPSENEDEVEW